MVDKAVKCVKKGHIKEADTVVNCSKCRKPRYRARNGDFCGQECPNTSAGGMMVDKATINNIENGVVEPTVVTTVLDTYSSSSCKPTPGARYQLTYPKL